MIHPSYTELIDAINTNNEEDDNSLVLNSRYSLVLAASKRARQLIAGARPLVENAAGKKPLAIAIDELYKGKVKILAGKGEDEELSLEETDVETQDVIETGATDEAGDAVLDAADESAESMADSEAADTVADVEAADSETADTVADGEAGDDEAADTVADSETADDEAADTDAKADAEPESTAAED